MNHPQSGSSNASPGLIAGLMGMGRNIFSLLINRVELFALELEEIKATSLRLMFFFALGVIAIWFAVACATALVVVLTWDSMGWKILLILAGIFFALALGMLFYIRSIIAQGKLSLIATMSELRKDRDALL